MNKITNAEKKNVEALFKCPSCKEKSTFTYNVNEILNYQSSIFIEKGKINYQDSFKFSECCDSNGSEWYFQCDNCGEQFQEGDTDLESLLEQGK